MDEVEHTKLRSKQIEHKIDRFENNNQGYAVVNFLIALPLFLAGIIFLFLLMSHIEVQSHLYNICRSELLQTQSTVNQSLTLLMALNPIVKATKWASVALKVAIVFSYTNPVLATIFYRILKGADSLKEAIAKMQKMLILNMKTTLRLGTLRTKTKLQISFYQYQAKLKNLVKISRLSLRYKENPLPAVEPTNRNESPSTYRLKHDFEREQQIYINWDFNSKIQLKFSPYAILDKGFKGKCIFSLEESKPWKAIQIAAR
jgi:hypothetical protein